MKLRAAAALLITTALLGCTTQKTPPLASLPPATLTSCKASEAAAVTFKSIAAALAGKCVSTRGLAVRGLFYENGASFAATRDPTRQQPGSAALALFWQAEEPASLKSHPQFVELTGRVVACGGELSCPSGVTHGLAVGDFRIIPTAMD